MGANSFVLHVLDVNSVWAIKKRSYILGYRICSWFGILSSASLDQLQGLKGLNPTFWKSNQVDILVSSLF